MDLFYYDMSLDDLYWDLDIHLYDKHTSHPSILLKTFNIWLVITLILGSCINL